jgi:ribose/xylose/arabinose/galactoside ABC-type transport system permease subunit
LSETTASAPPRVAPRASARLTPATLALYAFIALVAALVLIGALTTQGFLTAGNFRAILTSTAFVGIMAVGATLIMLGGSLFSISLGLTTALCSIIFMYALSLGVIPAIVATLLAGALIFVAQGAVIGGIGANPIVVTIGAGAIQDGFIGWISPGDIVPPPGANIDFLARTFFGLPVSAYVFIVVAIVTDLWIRRSRFGRELYMLGENPRAARAAGLPVERLTITAFAVAGFCVAIAAILIAGFARNVNLQVQGTYTFDVIAAILVGGNAVTGGRGSVARTVVGALVIATISDILLLLGASTGVQILIKGFIVLAVVVLLHLTQREWRAS